MAQERDPFEKSSATRAVRAGIESDLHYGAVVPPLVLSTNFSFKKLGVKREYDYTRSGNPTREQLGSTISELEHAAGGVVTASGMAAVFLVTQLLGTGESIIVTHDCYGGTYRLFNQLREKKILKVHFVDLKNEMQLTEAISLRPKMIWVETPSNPLLRVIDIRKVAELCKKLQALCVVDNTFLSPALQQPILLGADIVVHSTTKYLNGHSDVVGGAVVAANKEIVERLTWWANCLGLTGSPFDSYLTSRGLRTLYPRLKAHEENARNIAHFLAEHPAVKNVYYPGLKNHPEHELAKRQQRGFGAMLSFELSHSLTELENFLSRLRYFSLAESLGGVESLIAHPATMTHAAMGAEARKHAGISDSLIRLSVGIEDTQDLIADLEQALEKSLGQKAGRNFTQATSLAEATLWS